MSGIYFIHWVYYHLTFLKKIKKLNDNLNECFEKLKVILKSVTKNNLSNILKEPVFYFDNVEIKNFVLIYNNLHQKNWIIP